jgi:hypothetical protein
MSMRLTKYVMSMATTMGGAGGVRYPHAARWYLHIASLQCQSVRLSSTSSSPQTMMATPPTTVTAASSSSSSKSPSTSVAAKQEVLISSKRSELPPTPAMTVMAKYPDIEFEGYVFSYVEGGGTTHSAEILNAPPAAVFKTMVRRASPNTDNDNIVADYRSCYVSSYVSYVYMCMVGVTRSEDKSSRSSDDAWRQTN